MRGRQGRGGERYGPRVTAARGPGLAQSSVGEGELGGVCATESLSRDSSSRALWMRNLSYLKSPAPNKPPSIPPTQEIDTLRQCEDLLKKLGVKTSLTGASVAAAASTVEPGPSS